VSSPDECTSPAASSTWRYTPADRYASATINPVMNPAHWPRRSTAAVVPALILCWKKHAAPGNVTSGVIVANATRSMSPTASPAFASASCAGATASSDGPMASVTVGRDTEPTRCSGGSACARPRIEVGMVSSGYSRSAVASRGSEPVSQ